MEYFPNCAITCCSSCFSFKTPRVYPFYILSTNLQREQSIFNLVLSVLIPSPYFTYIFELTFLPLPTKLWESQMGDIKDFFIFIFYHSCHSLFL